MLDVADTTPPTAFKNPVRVPNTRLVTVVVPVIVVELELMTVLLEVILVELEIIFVVLELITVDPPDMVVVALLVIFVVVELIFVTAPPFTSIHFVLVPVLERTCPAVPVAPNESRTVELSIIAPLKVDVAPDVNIFVAKLVEVALTIVALVAKRFVKIEVSADRILET
jgi:hypothetical protein